MSRLNDAARERLRWAGIRQVDWARHHFASPTWGGDACGCPDDRCIGYHHDESDECHCLHALLESDGDLFLRLVYDGRYLYRGRDVLRLGRLGPRGGWLVFWTVGTPAIDPDGDPAEHATLAAAVAAIDHELRPMCSGCGGELGTATGVCTVCGHDELGYYDDMPDLKFWSIVGPLEADGTGRL